MPKTTSTPSVTINGRAFTLPVLTLGGLKRVRAQLLTAKDIKPGEIPTAEEIDAMIAIVHAAAKLAEPELTIEEFVDHVEGIQWDDTSLVDAFMQVMTGSGLTKARADGEQGAGEGAGPASSISSPSTGS